MHDFTIIISVNASGAVNWVRLITVPALGVRALRVEEVGLGSAHVVSVSLGTVPRQVSVGGAQIECLGWAQRLKRYDVGLIGVPRVVLFVDLHAQLVEPLLDLIGVFLFGVLAARVVDLALNLVQPRIFVDVPSFLDGELNFVLEVSDHLEPLLVELFLQQFEDFVAAGGTLIARLEQFTSLGLDLGIRKLVDQIALTFEHRLVLGMPPIPVDGTIENCELIPGVLLAVTLVQVQFLLADCCHLVSEESSDGDLYPLHILFVFLLNN